MTAWTDYGPSSSACPATLPSGLGRQSAARQGKVEFKFHSPTLHVASSSGTKKGNGRFEFQYAETMWYNVSREQSTSSCLPTGVEMSFSVRSVFWFVSGSRPLTIMKMSLGHIQSVCHISNKPAQVKMRPFEKVAPSGKMLYFWFWHYSFTGQLA